MLLWNACLTDNVTVECLFDSINVTVECLFDSERVLSELFLFLLFCGFCFYLCQ